MSFSVSTYKIIKSLKPTELFEIITAGYCCDYFKEFKLSVTSIKGDWYLDNWSSGGIKLDVIDFYLSDTGLMLYTSRKESERLELEFKNMGIFTEVWSRWYGGKTWVFGFNYSSEAFNKLHKEWIRNKKIDKIIN